MLIIPYLFVAVMRLLPVRGDPHPAGISARRHFHARPLLRGEGPRAVHPGSLRAADGEGRSPGGRAGRAAAGRDLARQRLGQGKRRPLFPHRRSRAGDHQGGGFHGRDQPTRADDAALGPRQARARRDAGRARQAQRRHPGDPRPADRRLGHQGRQRRDQAHRPQREAWCAPSPSRPRPSGCAAPR